MGPTLLREPPRLLKLLPLGIPTDEGRLGDGCRVLAPHFALVSSVYAQLLVHGTDRFTRWHPEVALQHLGVPMVRA